MSKASKQQRSRHHGGNFGAERFGHRVSQGRAARGGLLSTRGTFGAIFAVAAAALVLAASLAGPSNAAPFTQRSGSNYIAWEAEDYHSLTSVIAANGFSIVSDAGASHGQAIESSGSHYTTPPGGDIAAYQLQFDAEGTYRLYFRRINSPSGDSLFRGPDFDEDPAVPPSPHVRYDLNWTWLEDDWAPPTGYPARYTVEAGDLGSTLELRIGSREVGHRIDRFVLSTDTGLSDAQLDALANWNELIRAIGDGDWSDGGNWEYGTPGPGMFTYLGEGHTLGFTTGSQAARVLAIGYDNEGRAGDGTLNQSGGDMTVSDRLDIGNVLNGGASIAGEYNVSGGTLTIGSSTDRADLWLGVNTAGTDDDASGTLDLSGATQFDAHLDTLKLGEVTKAASSGTGKGTLKLAATNNIDATQIIISDSQMYQSTQPLSSIELGNVNNIATDLLMVGGSRSRAELSFAGGTGTLTLGGSSGAKAELRVAYTDLDTSNTGIADMDLTGGVFNATLSDITIGYHKSKTGTDTGTLTFDDGTITADSLTVGTGGVSHNGKANANGTMTMRGGDFSTGAAVLGEGAGKGTGTVNVEGGSFTASSLALGQGATDATYGDGTAAGTLNVAGGTVQINGDASLGTGTASSTGQISMTGGTMTVTGDVTNGVGTGTIGVEAGTLAVTGDLDVDYLATVGTAGRTGSVSAGGAVSIGASGTMNIGLTDTAVSSATLGTADFSNADSVWIDLDRLEVGILRHDVNETVTGTLRLSNTGSNTVQATEIMLGESTAGWSPAVRGNLHLGADNTIRADRIYVGNQKAAGAIDIAAGGTLNLEGLSGAETDLYIGYCNNATTSAVNHGVVDLSGGSVHATLDELVVGYHLYPWNHQVNGRGWGELTIDDGAVQANTVTIGSGDVDPPNQDYDDPAHGRGVGTVTLNGGEFEATTIALGVGSPRAEGTLNLSGATLKADTIDDGVGTAHFNFTDGVLSVGTFGFDLVQDGGTLAPGSSVGTTLIEGDYTLNAGELSLELDGRAGPGVAGGHDQLIVQGDVTLAGGTLELLLGFDPATTAGLGSFVLVDNQGSNPVDGIFAGLPQLAQLAFDVGGETYEATLNYYGGDGNDIVLSRVPEPAALGLLGLGVFGLLMWRGRRRK